MPSNGKSPTTLGILVGTLRSIFAPHDMTEGLLITISPFEKMTMSINFLIIGQTLRKNVICDQKDPLLRSFPFHQWYGTKRILPQKDSIVRYLPYCRVERQIAVCVNCNEL